MAGLNAVTGAEGRLGCLDSIEAYVTDQCGTPRICSLSNVSEIQFNRILDEISQAVVKVPVSTGVSSTKPCCDCLDVIEPWCHELHIVRNGEEVWSGPITRVTYGYEAVVVEASDVLAWLQVRVPQGILNNTQVTTSIEAGSNGVDVSTFTGASSVVVGSTVGWDSNFATNVTTGAIIPKSFTVNVGTVAVPQNITLTYTGISGNTLTGVSSNGATGVLATGDVVTGPSDGDEITDLALDVLETAFNEHDPCVIDYVVQTDLDDRPTLFANTVISTETGFTSFEGTVFDWLEILADLGLDYTVIGRTILLSVENVNQARVGTLRDEHILGEIEVTKDGWSMATRVFTRFQDDDNGEQCAAQNPDITFAPCPAISEAEDLRTTNKDKTSVCYGPIERLFDDTAAFNYTTAKQAADAYIRDGSIAPRLVDFSTGTRLAPDTPWEINDIIPGQKVFVSLSNLCIDINQAFKVLEMGYTLTAEGEEEITVSLGAIDVLGSLT